MKGVVPMKMQINTKKASYPLYYSESLHQAFMNHNELFASYKRAIVITEQKVYQHFYEQTQSIFNQPLNVEWFICPNGEQAKSLVVYQELLSFVLEKEMATSETLVIAFGGGSILELAGFFAGTFRDGFEMIQIPTTIASFLQIGRHHFYLNHQETKNVMQATAVPLAVFYDGKFLATLPEKEVQSGLFLLIQIAFMLNPVLLKELVKQFKTLEKINPTHFMPFIIQGIETILPTFLEGTDTLLYSKYRVGEAIASSGQQSLTAGEKGLFDLLWSIQLGEEEQLVLNKEALASWLLHLGFDKTPLTTASTSETLHHLFGQYGKIKGSLPMIILTKIGQTKVQAIEKEEIMTLFEQFKTNV